MPRRRAGDLLPIEIGILTAGMAAIVAGEREFHGFQVATALRDAESARRLTAHGTLYKALARLEGRGLLASRWEDPDIAVAAGRPRRRLYQVTGAGELALQSVPVAHAVPRPSMRRAGAET
jgi:DNA-binding PadR family transcriptional regulator